MQALGREASARVLDRRLVAASETVARQLSLQRGAAVARIQRVRLADGVPLSFDETYLPQELGEKIMADDLENQPIFSLLEQKYATPLLEAEYRLAAVASHGTVARALGMEPGSPIFLIERTTFSGNHRPVDYERLYYRGDHIRFVTRLARRAPARRASLTEAVQIGLQLWLFAMALGTSMLGGVLGMASGIFIVPDSDHVRPHRYSHRHWRKPCLGDRLFVRKRSAILEGAADQHSAWRFCWKPPPLPARCAACSWPA